MKFLFQSISEGSCLLNLEARNMEEIVESAVNFLVQTGRLPEQQRQMVSDGILQRERAVPTVIGHACAVPHFYDEAISGSSLVFVRLKNAVNLGAPDGIATRYIFLMIGSMDQTTQHLDTLSSIARLMSDNVFHFETTYATSQQDVLDAIERHINRTVLAAPPRPREVPAGLRAGGWPFAGLISDIRRRLPHYIDDFKSGFQVKSIASIVFMFFACLAPAVTFGGLMGLETGGSIGAPEMLMSTAFCGLVYALFAGQPLIILGGIGPLLVFTIILYELCGDMGYGDQFLGVYGWVGLWTALMTMLLAVFNVSNMMRFFTRFTDEIFSVLMSLIYIYKAIQALFFEFRADEAVSHEKALLALVLAVGTFYIAMTLASIRTSRYLLPWIREFLADFGPSIALVCMIAVAWTLGDASTLETLTVSGGDSQAASGSIFVNLGAVPTWIKFAAALPAALATVLVFLSQNITVRLLNSPENKLTKGDTYHLDLAVVGGLIGFCSLFGWPWMVAATVRTLAHMRALASVEEVASGGDKRQEIIHVQENRVTGVAIHALIAGTLLALPLLEYVPMAALYGIFLFMGFASLRGIQFIERLGYLFMDSALYPINHYTRRVPTRTIHLFTLVQLVALVVLCIVNVIPYGPIQIMFPVFIVLLVPLRSLLNRFFKRDHLAFLDADEVPAEENSHWV
ncbi:PTS system fructose-specific EIIABC component [Rubripirellula lacrimiformis]|uniref:PTS system fructose-specific EIIABC component n=1 Tax=Rubripirellula lacrimiformis TaxID=1930273 RepID=A0A517N677_9BACT|nr:PTS sugar transporter subunit IIA [Rubripirellula lacrimiformis]QDT02632.1 PTS system fructose-specific EIIABC component [Rubripirellula lacrimiformis]